MGRKHLLEHLISPPETLPSAPQAIRKPMPRGVGLVGAMSESVETMVADLRDAKEKLETGDVIVEIDTDLIDPSFITDRIGEDDEMDAFVATIRDQGQRTPILLRPHPESRGRYQIAFGHRRYRALKRLGRPVRAMVKHLTDEELVVAQGQENQDRLDLSYIERALFAARLEARQFQRDVICLALSIDKTEVSRMISIATALPAELVEAIGPAQKTGRRKWMILAKTVKEIRWPTEMERLLQVCKSGGAADSDQRFDLVLKALSRCKSTAQADDQGGGRPSFTVDKKPGVIRIRFDETSLPKDMVEDLMSRVRHVCTSFGAKT
ncbi:plasmid partitioning protein RepB [Acidiphilium sp. JA12-A1]|uniref:plasmid partitioning protein RepB n=1 Tax=Acidiphilium sp. JA12-A1 TaxID=1464546 RepID=UPI000461AD0F|nr:plasmid partitioning protein RepB [Acidiphilium sp. JA12-A1]KDM68291.1 replication protein B [Acidiphilium sp. JA12-A1]